MMFPHSRRSFLQRSISSAALVALSQSVPQFLLSASAHASQTPSENILVVIQLTGGNDGLNTLVPYGDDAYYRNRRLLGIPKPQVRKIDDYVGLHPSMAGFSKLLEEQKLGIVQGAGYPVPDRSHFSSMDIWQTARREGVVANVAVDRGADPRATGWLGRYLENRQMAGKSSTDVPAIHLPAGASKLPLALIADHAQVASIQSIDSFKLDDGGDVKLRHAVERATAARRESDNGLVAFLHEGVEAALASSHRVQEAVRNYKTEIRYPESNLARRLKTIAQLIDAGVGARVYYLDHDGFDTHSNQATVHAGLLSELSAGLAAFIADVSEHGHGDRVLAMTFSEFGRRVHENASQGTDHGTAAPMFLAGGRVLPGLLGKYPSLTDLDEGDLRFTVDFRRVYAGVLESWLKVSSERVLGQQFSPLQIVRG
jgi:uncharacterized protein (DUF1501 family)